ncbi:MAG: hypothetical protein IJ746_07365 [Ruminococcus sp.]|nr:hypothetical protein [Ruminococcus sp.]
MEMKCKICNNPITSSMKVCPFCETTLRPAEPDFGARRGFGMKSAGFSGAVMDDDAPALKHSSFSSGTAHCLRCGCDYDASCAVCPTCGYPEPKERAVFSAAPPPMDNHTIYAGTDLGDGHERYVGGERYPRYTDAAPQPTMPPYGSGPSVPDGRYGAYPPYPMPPAKKEEKNVLKQDISKVNPLVVILAVLGVIAFIFLGCEILYYILSATK